MLSSNDRRSSFRSSYFIDFDVWLTARGSSFALHSIRCRLHHARRKVGKNALYGLLTLRGLLAIIGRGRPILYGYVPGLWLVYYELLCEKYNESACIR